MNGIINLDDQYGSSQDDPGLQPQGPPPADPAAADPSQDTVPPQPASRPQPQSQQPTPSSPPVPASVPSAEPSSQIDPEASEIANILATNYGFENGMLNYNGELTHFDDLDPAAQGEVIRELIEQEKSTAVAELHDDVELDMLNLWRSGASDEEMAAFFTRSQTDLTQIQGRSDDDAHLADIRNKFADISDDDAQAELAHRKLSSRYTQEAAAYRNQQVNAAKQGVEVRVQERYNQRVTAHEESANQFAVPGKKDTYLLDTAPVSPQVLDWLINESVEPVNEHGLTALDQMMLDPAQRMRARYYLEFGPQLHTYYQQQIALAHKQGREDAIKGTPSGARRSAAPVPAGGRRSNGPKESTPTFRLGEDPSQSN